MHNPNELHDDDIPVGRLLTRREILKLLGGASAAAIVGTGFTKFGLPQIKGAAAQTPLPTATALPTCVVKPALTEGPYFVETILNRSDIRVDPTDESIKDGIPMRLRFNVSDVSSDACAPLPGAQVDVWHCDALGVYSGVSDPGFDTSEQLWLRGYQVTDENGIAEFLTIFPGWYSGRAVHIHFKIRTDPESDQGYEFTSQLFFEPETTEEVYALAPYDQKGTQDVPNERDNIFQNSEGLLTLSIAANEDDEEDEAVYIAVFDIGLDLSEPSPSESGGGQGGPGGNPPGGGQGGPGGGNGTPPPRPGG